MYPELINIGGFSLHSYGVMVALAFVSGILAALWLGKKEGLKAEIVLDGILWVMIAAVLGARIFYVIEYRRELSSFLEAFMVWRGGLVFYGGLIFAVLALVCFSKKNKLSVFKVLDIAAPCTAIGYAVGRIGCFLNGCCYGQVSPVPWAVAGKHPTQLYESFGGLLIFIVLIVLCRFKRFEGELFCVGLALYSVFRFLNEFLRINPRYLFDLSEAQLISIVLFIFGIILYAVLNKRSPKKPAAG